MILKQTIAKAALLAIKDGVIAPPTITLNTQPRAVAFTLKASIDVGELVVLLWETELSASESDRVDVYWAVQQTSRVHSSNGVIVKSTHAEPTSDPSAYPWGL